MKFQIRIVGFPSINWSPGFSEALIPTCLQDRMIWKIKKSFIREGSVGGLTPLPSPGNACTLPCPSDPWFKFLRWLQFHSVIAKVLHSGLQSPLCDAVPETSRAHLPCFASSILVSWLSPEHACLIQILGSQGNLLYCSLRSDGFIGQSKSHLTLGDLKGTNQNIRE